MVAELVPMPSNPADLYRVARFHAFEEGGKRLLLVVENAAFAELDAPSAHLAALLTGRERARRSELRAALAAEFGEEEADATLLGFEQLEILGPFDRPKIAADAQLVMTPLSSLVLHVSHDCNLRCGYCYADFGRYGSDPGIMTEALAIEHTARFFDQLGGTKKIHVTFFGGEPLMNLPVVFAAHRYAKERAAREGRSVAFGLTTNGTLLTEELARFFAQERFTITVSIDGPPDVNDRLRPLQEGGGSYDVIMDRVRTSGVQAIARVTLTRRSTDVARIVRHLVAAGFREVGMSPVATGNERFDLGDAELAKVLDGMRVLADDFVAWAKQGRVFPFSNIKSLVEQIAAGDPRGVPCGAGTKLAAADNKGDLYACHRLVGEEQFKIGHVSTGVDPERRFALIKDMHPRGREPCNDCWARYLCGGGCHHIAWLHTSKQVAPWTISNGFCDFLRAWYRLGLHTYARMLDEAPDVLARLGGERASCSQPSGL
ncbi:radical SAM protein [Myxococcota bacterium]|nr:radical SAM protein [Myxococcota bacterium]